MSLLRMRSVALAPIRLYQRHVSPHKGFRCAYGVHTGAASCSALGYRAIRRFGIAAGMAVLRQRLHRCGVAHRRFGAAVRPRHRLASQAGFCDGCDGCDLSTCDGCDLGDWDCVDGCGLPGRKRSEEDDASVHIPVRSHPPGGPGPAAAPVDS